MGSARWRRGETLRNATAARFPPRSLLPRTHSLDRCRIIYSISEAINQVVEFSQTKLQLFLFFFVFFFTIAHCYVLLLPPSYTLTALDFSLRKITSKSNRRTRLFPDCPSFFGRSSLSVLYLASLSSFTPLFYALTPLRLFNIFYLINNLSFIYFSHLLISILCFHYTT